MSLEIRDLVASYSTRPVLKGISADIGPGVTSILGPNGAGKSTLVKCLANVIKPDSGSLSFNGMNLSGERDPNLKMAYLSQDLPYITGMSVLEVMLLGRVGLLSLKVTEEDLEKSYAALESLNMEEFADRGINELSGGQQQMIMIAQCLVADPELIILDEPMNNLDLRKELEMFDVVTKLAHDKNLTAVMVLHDINFASRYSDNIAVLKDGEIYAHGTPSEVVSSEMIRDVYGVEAEVYPDSDGLPKIDPKRSVFSKG